MTKTLVDIPDDLLKSVMDHYEVTTKKEAVVLALKDARQRSRARRLPDAFRTLDLDDETIGSARR